MPIIVEDANSIKQKILGELREILSSKFVTAAELAEKKIKILVRDALRNAPEYLDMLPGGSLYGEIGNPNIEVDLEIIINLLVTHITLDAQLDYVSVDGQRLNASFLLNLIRDDFADILSLQAADFVTEKGSTLPWLRWLLLDGVGTRLIIGYEYLDYAPKGHTSRTNEGVMIHAKDSFWALPEHGGVRQDNWITRAMDSAKTVILDTIEREFINQLQ